MGRRLTRNPVKHVTGIDFSIEKDSTLSADMIATRSVMELNNSYQLDSREASWPAILRAAKPLLIAHSTARGQQPNIDLHFSPSDQSTRVRKRV